MKVLNKDVLTHFDQLQLGATEFVRKSPVIAGAVLGVGGTLGTIGVAKVVGAGVSKISKKIKKPKHKKKVRRSKRKISKTPKRRKRRRYTPHTAGKRKDRSTRRIRYTKKGQPYVITRSGKAKFIKMSSAKRSHRLKGGRY